MALDGIRRCAAGRVAGVWRTRSAKAIKDPNDRGPIEADLKTIK
jgi:hypothetical protein